MEDNLALSSEFFLLAPTPIAEKGPGEGAGPLGSSPQSQTRGNIPVVNSTPTKKECEQGQFRSAEGRKPLWKSPLPWPGPTHPAASNLVATSAGVGGTWLVPAAEARWSCWLSPGALALGRLPSAEPPEGAKESAQESVRGQLRGRHEHVNRGSGGDPTPQT